MTRPSLKCSRPEPMRRLEDYFAWHGRTVARHPYKVLASCLLATAVCGLGLLRFRQERQMINLWVAADAQYRMDDAWVREHFPRQLRAHHLIFRAENVLEPAVLREMARVRQKVMDLSVGDVSWADVCLRVPIITKPKCLDKFNLFDSFFGRRRKRAAEEEVDECADVKAPDLSAYSWTDLTSIKFRMETEGFTPALAEDVSLLFYPEPYCDFVKMAPTVCYEDSVLELWAKDGSLDPASLQDLSLQDVVTAVNTRNTSGILMADKDILNSLGGKRFGPGGLLESAEFASLIVVGKVNLTELGLTGTFQTGHPVDRLTNIVEVEMSKQLTDNSDVAEGVTVFTMVANMFFESLENEVFKDARLLMVGYMIVFLYVCLMLGRCSSVHQRFFLSLGGMMGVVMGMAVSYSLCSAMGFFYGPTHTVLPFLLLGIGIDNMFVIRQCLTTLGADERKGGVEERMGRVLSRAGAAITITSITDFIAFGIGASTVLPTLRSFCIYSAVGILVIFLFQITWFSALLALDEKRIDASRDGCLPCITRNQEGSKKEGGCSLGDSSDRPTRLFAALAKLLVRRPAKVVVLGLAALLLSVGLWGAAQLSTEFRAEWLVDPTSEVGKWLQQKTTHFNSDGAPGALYIKAMDYPANWGKLESLMTRLRQEDVLSSIDSWTDKFQGFLDRLDDKEAELDGAAFQEKLSHFLFSPVGAKYRAMFKFKGDLVCGQPAPQVSVSAVDFQFPAFTSASQWVPAMDRLYQVVAEANITAADGSAGVLNVSPFYANWSADKVIQRELYKNLGSAIIAIFITVLLFLASLRGAGLVIFCVAATITEVAGFLHFWGLTMNVLTCVILVISVGLCVDFSAHVVHFFLAAQGDREQRILLTMTRVGPAVFNGGLSTLLAFILLSTSQSYVFLSFFKIFFLICVFGLFHGLLVLPVLLATLGPPARGQGGPPSRGQEQGQEMQESKGRQGKEEEGVVDKLLLTQPSDQTVS